jgi:hypothetical protein
MLKIFFLSLLFIFLNPLFADTIKKISSSNSWDVKADFSPTITGDFKACTSVFGVGAVAFGVSTSLGNDSYNSIDWSFYIEDYEISFYENGSRRGNYYNVSDNDILCISRTGNTFKYLLNNSVFYTSGAKSTSNLLIDVAMYSPDSILKSITINDVSASASNLVNAEIVEDDIINSNLDDYQLNFLYGLSGIICASFLLYRIS